MYTQRAQASAAVEPVADPGLRRDVLRMLRIQLDLLPQSFLMNTRR